MYSVAERMRNRIYTVGELKTKLTWEEEYIIP